MVVLLSFILFLSTVESPFSRSMVERAFPLLPNKGVRELGGVKGESGGVDKKESGRGIGIPPPPYVGV